MKKSQREESEEMLEQQIEKGKLAGASRMDMREAVGSSQQLDQMAKANYTSDMERKIKVYN